MLTTSHWFQRTHDLTLQLVRMPSINGSSDETAFAQQLHDLLAALPYFRQHPENLRIMRTVGDPHERYNVFALVRGRGQRTVLLSGHYDVVSIDNYGDLRELATQPDLLLPRLLDRLRTSHNNSDQRALAELSSGEWMPGRGALDMKSGLAAGIAVLERFAADPNREGNLLFVATPDEEATSQGMRSAVLALPKLAAEWGLSIEAAINLDSGVDEGEGMEGRAVYLGSVGKLLPSVYFVGRPTHAGAPFDGINAALLAAELTRWVEGNVIAGDSSPPNAAHQSLHAVAPPPVALYQTDRRAHYDVTTAATAWCSFNLLTYWRSPTHVMAHMVALTHHAMTTALGLWRERARQYAKAMGLPVRDHQWQPLVLTYAQLCQRAVDIAGVQAGQHIHALAQQLSADAALDTIAISQRLIDALIQLTQIEGPAAIVNFASLYYPRVELGGSARGQRLEQAATHAAHMLSSQGQYPILVRPFFPGISDMSFLACRDDDASISAMAENTPAWGTRLQFDFGVPASLDLPVINAGPYGRDYHQSTERVHMPYSFGVVPELVWRIAMEVLHHVDN